ncbi:MAG: hypothetical protein Q4C42_01985 [Clostridia bacterium]|nr:hypothetical protein [Clostridia bacterium]
MKEKLYHQFVKPQMTRRIMMVMIAHIIMSFGTATLKLCLLGTDPFSAMMLGLTAKTGMSYGNFCALANCSFFVIEILWGRQYIGFGSIVNWFMLGYLVDAWSWVYKLIVPNMTDSLVVRVPLCCVAIVILAFSLSLYQSADIGSSPYDSMPLVMRDKLHLPFAVARILLDAFSVAVAFISGGIIGLGTILVVLFLGPICAFFNRNFSEKLVNKA